MARRRIGSRMRFARERIVLIRADLFLDMVISPIFVERMNKHIDYYKGNLQVSTGFSFLTKVIKAWYPVTINSAESVTKSQECSTK